MKLLRVLRDGCLIPLVATVLVGWLASYYYTYNRWSGAVPKEISLGKKLDSETPIIISLGGSGGYAVFKLKSSTSDKINQADPNYFTNKTKPRKWNNTIKWIETGDDAFLSIYTNYNKKYENTIRDAFKADGNYLGFYSNNTRILIIPKEQLLIIGYLEL